MTTEHLDRGPLDRAELARLVAADIPRGAYVNLGIGQPTTVADHLSEGSGVVLHTENGMLGMGRAARPDEVDPDLVNAGKMPECRSPLTGRRCVTRVYTEHAVLLLGGGRVEVRETYGLSAAELRARTGLPVDPAQPPSSASSRS